MKLNTIRAIICVFIALLIALALWQIPAETNQKWTLAIGGAVMSAAMLVFGLGMRYDNPAIATNVRVLSTLSLIVGIAFSIIIGVIGFSLVVYFVIAGLILAFYLLALNGLLAIARKNPKL